MMPLAAPLAGLLKSLPPRPIDEQVLAGLARRVLGETKSKCTDDNRKSQWEYLLKKEIFKLGATEGAALKDKDTKYYDELQDKLDLILVFTEQDACEQVFPFVVLEDLLETQTIASCSHIFEWIESRSQRLTSGMVPQKGKALVLLRTLNDLLRRLSKMGETTMFCGRILTFLSGVFPLGERSGVNLRGEYGPVWEGVKAVEAAAKKEAEGKDDKMQVDEDPADSSTKKLAPSAKPALSKEELYSTFWSLQLPFSRPPIFATPNVFAEFRESVNAVLPCIKEANAKERAMLGSRSGTGTVAGLKRKREVDASEESSATDYFFAKFLTSPELLDLELADTHFRRQYLFQLLVLLTHLLTFTKAAKVLWSTPRNRSLQMDFTLEPADAQWAQETVNKAIEELRQTTPNGRAFAETVGVILEREKNWVKWKNELCAPFDKEPWSEEGPNGVKIGLEEATRSKRAKLREPLEDWPHKLGSEPLTEIWEMGYRDLHDLQNPFQPGEVKDFAKKVQQEIARIDMRKQTLAKAAERLAQARAKAAAKVEAPTPSTSTPDPALPSALKPDAPVVRSVTPSKGLPSSPLHHPLPAKPGSSSPQKGPEPPQIASPAPVIAPAVAPIIAAPQAVAAAPPQPAGSTQVDEQIAKYEENKYRWAWLALRTARDKHLPHFNKMGTADVLLLAKEIEKENTEKMDTQKVAKTKPHAPPAWVTFPYNYGPPSQPAEKMKVDEETDQVEVAASEAECDAAMPLASDEKRDGPS